MNSGLEQQPECMITGFQAIVALGGWVVAALAYGVYRSLGSADPDSIRPPGPLD